MKITGTNKQYFRVAIWNQIFTTTYYHVRMYERNPKTGKYHPTRLVYGHRGPGGSLGITYEQATALANRYNKEVGR